jgi:subtilisin family serine protease
VVQTWLSGQGKANEPQRTDDNVGRDSHGTMVASKAAGKMYGVAKEVFYSRVHSNVNIFKTQLQSYGFVIMSFEHICRHGDDIN